MSENPHPESPRLSHRFSPRTLMAFAIGTLVVTLSLSFGWFGNAWHFIQHRAPHHSTTQLAVEIHTEVRADSKIYRMVDSPPQLIGGLEVLQNRIQYPEMAKIAGIEGRVFLQFVVEPDGSVSNIVITRGLGGDCDEEAVRALGESRFVPGTLKGESVRVKMSIPVSFRLS